jgi:hypothetical protein
MVFKEAGRGGLRRSEIGGQISEVDIEGDIGYWKFKTRLGVKTANFDEACRALILLGLLASSAC